MTWPHASCPAAAQPSTACDLRYFAKLLTLLCAKKHTMASAAALHVLGQRLHDPDDPDRAK